MSQSGVIYLRKANQKPSAEFIQHLLDNCGKAWGATVLDKGVLDTFYGEDATAKSVLDAIEEFNELDIQFYFYGSDSAVNIKDVPPYPIIQNDDDQALVCILPEGNFPGFEKEKSSHPAIYWLAESLSNEFIMVYDLVDKDLDKFFAAIEKDSFKKKINLQSVSRGYLTVVGQNGKVLTFSQGDTAREFDHGWVSNAFGFADKKEEKVEEKPKTGGMFSRKSTVREKHVSHEPSQAVKESLQNDPPPKTETAVKDPQNNPPSVPQKPKEDLKALTIEDIKVSKVKVPAHYNRKGKIGYIKERIGYNPKGIDDPNQLFEVYTTPGGTTLTKADLNKMFGMSAAKLLELKPLNNPEAVGKDTASQHIDTARDPIQPLPILSGGARERAKQFISDTRVQKLISENASIITDPDGVQNSEAKVALFFQQIGEKDMSQWDCLPFIEIEKVGRADIHTLAVMAHTWRLRALRAENKLEAKKEKIVEKMKEQLAPVEEQPEEPKKTGTGGMFSRRR